MYTWGGMEVKEMITEMIGMMMLVLALVKMAEVVAVSYTTIAKDIEAYLNIGAKNRPDVLVIEMELFADGSRRLSFGQPVENPRATVEAFARSVAQHLVDGTLPDGDFLQSNGNVQEIDAEHLTDTDNQPTLVKALRRGDILPVVDSVPKARKFLSMDVGTKTYSKSLLTWYFQRIKASAKYVKKQNGDAKPKKQAGSAAAPDTSGADTGLYQALRADGLSPQEAIAQMKQLR